MVDSTDLVAQNKELSEQLIFLKRLVDYQRSELDGLRTQQVNLQNVNSQLQDMLKQAAERLAARPSPPAQGARQ